VSKPVTEYTFVDRGVINSQYYEGCGVVASGYWDDVAYGIGSTPLEAANDALECLAQNDWDVDNIVIPDDIKNNDPEHLDDMKDEMCDLWYHVEVYVKENENE